MDPIYASLVLIFLLEVLLLLYSIVHRLYLLIPVLCVLLGMQVYLFWRMRSFLNSLSKMINSLRQDEFSVTVEEREDDFLTRYLKHLAGAIRKSGEFEKLRRDRVLLYYRALSLILRNVQEPIIWLDLEKDFFRLNPSAQRLFEVEQEEYRLSGIVNLTDNEVFASWLEKLIRNDEVVPEEIACELALPVSKRVRVLYIKAILVRAGEENPKMMFLFLRPV